MKAKAAAVEASGNNVEIVFVERGVSSSAKRALGKLQAKLKGTTKKMGTQLSWHNPNLLPPRLVRETRRRPPSRLILKRHALEATAPEAKRRIDDGKSARNLADLQRQLDSTSFGPGQQGRGQGRRPS